MYSNFSLLTYIYIYISICMWCVRRSMFSPKIFINCLNMDLSLKAKVEKTIQEKETHWKVLEAVKEGHVDSLLRVVRTHYNWFPWKRRNYKLCIQLSTLIYWMKIAYIWLNIERMTGFWIHYNVTVQYVSHSVMGTTPHCQFCKGKFIVRYSFLKKWFWLHPFFRGTIPDINYCRKKA